MRSARGSLESRARALVPALLLCLVGACATVEMPRGGPEDKTPPTLVAFSPDSAAVGLRGVRELRFVFSEKVTPQPGERFLKLYPPLEIAKTRWKGRREVRVILLDTLPADTVLVVEIPLGITDVHRVPAVRSYRYPIATADSLPSGEVLLSLQQGDSAAVGGVVELYAVPPDTIDWFRQTPLRRVEADSLGRARLDWLPAPGGPWLVRAFLDLNRDGRAADNEAQRLLPVQARLDAETPIVDLGVFVLYDPREPGRLLGAAPAPDPWEGPVLAWALQVAEEDTGFAPVHATRPPEGLSGAAPGDTLILDPAGPGLIRAVFFVDLDGDSLLSALPDSSAADTLTWRWEPFALLEGLEVAPGLPLRAVYPGFADTLAPCRTAPPLPDPPDTLAVAPVDSLATASTDSLGVPFTEAAPDSLADETESP